MDLNAPIPPPRASLEVLRAEAAQELETVIHERLMAGEDPWDFMENLPKLDELVVYLLRSEAIVANGGQQPSRAREYRVLRRIALQHPGLTSTVWRLLGRDSSTFAWASGAGHEQEAEPSRSSEAVDWPSY